jgi:hypothetical protein
VLILRGSLQDSSEPSSAAAQDSVGQGAWNGP